VEPKNTSFALAQFTLDKMYTLRTPKGGLPWFSSPLDDPRWVPGAGASQMRPDDPVLGLQFGMNTWALPWWVMKNHHLANLVLDGRPVLVTLCERCSSCGAWDPVVAGRRLTFWNEGVYNGTVLGKDYESGSQWSAVIGAALWGPLRGTMLPRLPILLCRWEEWLETHPGTMVPEGADEPRDGHGSQFSPGCPQLYEGKFDRRVPMNRSILYFDERLPHNTLVLGATAGGENRCYPLPTLALKGRVVNDTLGGQDIAVFCRPGTWLAIAFNRTINGKRLTFATSGDAIVDENTGSVWEMSGAASSGPLKGSQLAFVYSGIEDFYIWATFFPQTDIYR
jgi:Protein of unknown function (DUF3179)